MSKFLAAIRALQHGSTLADPANWKRKQILIESASGLLLAVAFFLPETYAHAITPDTAQSIAAGFAALVQLFMAPALTVATTDKLGLPRQDPPADHPGPDRPEPPPDPDLYRGGG